MTLDAVCSEAQQTVESALKTNINAAANARETDSDKTGEALKMRMVPAFFAECKGRVVGSGLTYPGGGPAADLRGGCDDWKKAYRQIPTSDPSRSVVALCDPIQKQVAYFVVWGHCFGQLSAVNSFNAVAKFLAGMSRMFFAHCGGNYFDDHFTVEPTYMADSGQRGLACLAFALGFLFDEDKHTDMLPKFVYLGFSVQHDLSRAYRQHECDFVSYSRILRPPGFRPPCKRL